MTITTAVLCSCLACVGGLRISRDLKGFKKAKVYEPTNLDMNPIDEEDAQDPASDGWTSIDGRLVRDIPLTEQPILSIVPGEKTCTDENNYVVNGKFAHPSGPHRKYSVIKAPANNQSNCATVDDLLNAVKKGQRMRAGGPVDWTEPSYFVPHGCNIPHHSPTEVAKVFTKVAAADIQGDSLTRHMMLALTLLLKGNFYDGGVAHQGGWEQCTCDGQFSEALMCREVTDLRAIKQALPHKTCEEDDHSARVFWMNIGPHTKKPRGCNWHQTIQEYRQGIAAIRSQYVDCKVKPTFLITGLSAQARQNDHRFPTQAREHVTVFNDEVEKAFAADNKVHFVNFYNMSLDANSCEGYHYLTDVNIAKANTYLALVNLISQSSSQ